MLSVLLFYELCGGTVTTGAHSLLECEIVSESALLTKPEHNRLPNPIFGSHTDWFSKALEVMDC